jgi:hypothetical protein
MADFLVSDGKYRDLIYDDADRRSRRRRLPGGFRFGRIGSSPGRGALHHAGATLRLMIKAIANSKLRRMERELELRGIPIPTKSDFET